MKALYWKQKQTNYLLYFLCFLLFLIVAISFLYINNQLQLLQWQMQRFTIHFNEVQYQQEKLQLHLESQQKSLAQLQHLTLVPHQFYQIQQLQNALFFTQEALLLPKKTLDLLYSAQNALNAISDPDISTVKFSLHQLIQTLEHSNPSSLKKIISRLHALENDMNTLPLIHTPTMAPVTSPAHPLPSEAQTTPKTFSWYTLLAAINNAIHQLFIIQRRVEPVQPLLSTDQNIYLKQNLRLLVQQAVIAFLQEQPIFYQQSLQEIQYALSRYYSTSDIKVKTLLQELNALQKIPISSCTNQLSNIIESLQKIITHHVSSYSPDYKSTV